MHKSAEDLALNLIPIGDYIQAYIFVISWCPS